MGLRRHGITSQQGHQPREIYRLERRLTGSRLQSRELQQAIDDFTHANHLPAHLFHRMPPSFIQPRLIGQGVEIASHHGKRRTQLVGRIRHEIATHALYPSLAGRVPHEQQALPEAISRDQMEGQARIGVAWRWDDDGAANGRYASTTFTQAGTVQKPHEIRMAHQVLDFLAEVQFAAQTNHVRTTAIEPLNFVLTRQHDDTVRHGCRHLPEFPEQLRDAALVELLATVQPRRQCYHLTPRSTEIWRLFGGATAQPMLEADQLPQGPNQINDKTKSDANPRLPNSQAHQ